MTTRIAFLPQPIDGDAPTAAELDTAIEFGTDVVVHTITPNTDRLRDALARHGADTPTAVDQFRLWANLTGISLRDFANALTRLAETLQANQRAIDEAHAALEEAKTTGRTPHGRAAQTSPYDIGRRRSRG